MQKEMGQISINDYITLSEELSISKNENDFKMTKELYDKIMTSCDVRLISNLFFFSDAYNSTYNLKYKNDDDVVVIDKDEVFQRLLSLKDFDTIMLCLSDDKSFKRKKLAFDLLKKENNVSFIVQFIYQIDFNFDHDFVFLNNFIKENNLTDKILWKNVVKGSNLSEKNMFLLLKPRRNLALMYIINKGGRLKKDDRILIENYLQFEENEKELIEIDKDFYKTKIRRFKKNSYDEKMDNMINSLLNEEYPVQMTLEGYEPSCSSLFDLMTCYSDSVDEKKDSYDL